MLGGTESERGLLLDQFRTHVGREDDDRVPEVDLAPEAVGDCSLLQDLEQKMHDVGMGLLDFVEEDDRVGTAADRFGELTSLLMADITGRRSDEPGGGELLHVLRHVDLDERVGIAKHELGKRAGEEGLSDAGWAEEDE